MTSLNDLLESINPGMRLTKEFFRRVYGYELYNPGFADMAVSRLEAAGCSRARCYYEAWVSEYEAKYEKEMKEVAAWYHKRLREELLKKTEKRQKEGERKRARQQQMQFQQNSLQQWAEMSETLGFQPITTEN